MLMLVVGVNTLFDEVFDFYKKFVGFKGMQHIKKADLRVVLKSASEILQLKELS